MHTATNTERDLAVCLFHQGLETHAHRLFGAHRIGEQIVFRIFAPHAESVSVCGEFTDWRPDLLPMRQSANRGVWELTVRGDWIADGQLYKYLIRNGCREVYLADPFAVQAEEGGTASVIASLGEYPWRDDAWIAWRTGRFNRNRVAHRPIHIYELHADTWKRQADGSPYRYEALGRELVSYVKQMGYTHVSLSTENPFEETRTAGYFAPDSRYGAPHELRAFVDMMHEAGIGVILDVGGRSADEQGEDILWQMPSDPAWQSVLLSSAVFWIEAYHADGLRMRGVPSMLSPRDDGADAEAAAFLRRFNAYLAKEYPDVMTIAEECSSCGDGGLGFTLTLATGWMQDAQSYLETEIGARNDAQKRMVRHLTEPQRELMLLPMHGARGWIDRCAEDWRMQFAGMRTFLAYRMMHPGKKLTLMGNEFGQFRTWDPMRELDWFLLDYDTHAALQRYAAEWNHLYLEHPALWDLDTASEEPALLDPTHAAEGILTVRRSDECGDELIAVLNFSPEQQEDYRLRMSGQGIYEELLNSDCARYGGTGCTNPGRRYTERIQRANGEDDHVVSLSLPPMGALLLRRTSEADPRISKL